MTLASGRCNYIPVTRFLLLKIMRYGFVFKYENFLDFSLIIVEHFLLLYSLKEPPFIIL